MVIIRTNEFFKSNLYFNLNILDVSKLHQGNFAIVFQFKILLIEELCILINIIGKYHYILKNKNNDKYKYNHLFDFYKIYKFH